MQGNEDGGDAQEADGSERAASLPPPPGAQGEGPVSVTNPEQGPVLPPKAASGTPFRARELPPSLEIIRYPTRMLQFGDSPTA